MIKAIMQIDLNNALALRYHEVALKSFERVSDIFEIEVVQCVLPTTLLPELKDIPNALTKRSPQELASLHSNYRMAKRISEGERFWVLEHDAYLRPQHEDVFRMIMSKWLTKDSTFQLGMANEFWTTVPAIAKMYCEQVRLGWDIGPMSLLHRVTDAYCRTKKHNHRDTYWPMNRFKNPEWRNKTGVDINVSIAYNRPSIVIDSPITQILDEKYGGTVRDRKRSNKIYVKEAHPDVEWIKLDNE